MAYYYKINNESGLELPSSKCKPLSGFTVVYRLHEADVLARCYGQTLFQNKLTTRSF